MPRTSPPSEGKTTTTALADLSLYPGNARQGDVDAIAESLLENTQYKPISANIGTHTGRPMEVLAGNHTVMAARQIGWDTILVHWVDVDDERAAKIVAADNQTGRLGGFDPIKLAELVDGFGTNLKGTGFSSADVAAINAARDDAITKLTGFAPTLADPEGTADGEGPDPDEVIEVAEAVTRPGDIWYLGKHVVACIDCTNVLMVKELAGDCDTIVTDPPYCSGGFQESGKSAGSVGTNATHKQIANDRLSTRGYVALMKAALSTIDAVYAYVFTDWRMWTHLFDVVEASRFGVRSMIVWDKGTPGMGRGWRAQHELVMWAARESPKYPAKYGGRGNVVASKRTGNTLHTTQKPVDLISALLENTPMARKVYDPFAGSGTTLIACEQAGIECVATELDPAYVDVICARFQLATGITPQRNDGEEVDFSGLLAVKDKQLPA